MDDDRRRTLIYRIIFFVVLAAGAGFALWAFGQGGADVSDQGIFQFFSAPGAATLEHSV